MLKTSVKFKQHGFTIVELLVVIVVIGILAAITIVSYTGVSKKAVIASIQSDLSNASKKLEMYKVEHGSYPNTLTDSGSGKYCPTPIDAQYCAKVSSGNTLNYPTVGPNSQTYSLYVAAADTTQYVITNSKTVPAVSTGQPVPTVTIGSQVWMQYNVNTGTRVDTLVVNYNETAQLSGQKWCYDNLESNCAIYGGLYQWDEAMQHSKVPGAKGICPDGFHIPTDAQYTVLTTFLGGEANAGTRLKPGGDTGFNDLLVGVRSYSTSAFSHVNVLSYLWTSDLYDSSRPWYRSIQNNTTSFMRNAGGGQAQDTGGASVRCLKD